MVAAATATITAVISALQAVTGSENAGPGLAFLAAATITALHCTTAAVIIRSTGDAKILATARGALTRA